MDTNPSNNPFESPTAGSDAGLNNEIVLNRVRMAWLLPAIGLVLLLVLVAMEAFGIPTSLSLLLLLGIFLTIIGGLAMTIYGVATLRSTPEVTPHVLAGITTLALLILIFCGGFVLIFTFFFAMPGPD